MKKEYLKIVEPLVLIGWCPQCNAITKNYKEDVTVQELFEDDIIHRSLSKDHMKHTPYIMSRVVS